MLKEAAGIQKVVLKTGRTDLRRGIDGLKAIILLNGMDPLEKGTLYLFCGRRNDRIRCLTYEGLSVDFCYPHIFRLIRKTRSLNDMYFVKCADNTFYRRPQRRASSSSSSGHSGSSFPDEMTPVPFSIAARFCSNDGNA